VRAGIWAERDKFDAGAAKMQQEMVKLNTVAKGSDQAAIKAAVGAVGQSCKSCHDNCKKE
jgi:cytochrome c556